MYQLNILCIRNGEVRGKSSSIVGSMIRETYKHRRLIELITPQHVQSALLQKSSENI